ncbi:Ig-like domain-containing protein [Jiangella gansuensis]|uniref:Ig-like domain-containing protein n=1 Tax=Jiangella gansuensis TaxID=281473 RepID=UPI0004B22F82|nr:Ig-like domain-containing protein [Jiangella gansuensis]
MTETPPPKPANGIGRRSFLVGAALTPPAIMAVQQVRAPAARAEPGAAPAAAQTPAGGGAPDVPAPGKLEKRTPPAQQQAVVGNTVPAFPGAEGAGKLTTGGRGHAVYEVTTLADSGPGSLRDAVSQSNRMIVFRVGGTIELEGGLDVVGSNLTIAGQTAPGDGIAVVNNEFSIKGDNIIVRYLRVRAGDRMQAAIDTFNGRGRRNLVIDHCSIAWGIDECFSLYGNYDVTVSHCIIAEGLTMSAHEKGRHGYGGLWGGENVTYHHNLLIHQGGRNPRFSFTEDMEQLVDHRNNVIYDYGFTSCFGGEWCEGVNLVANYYKPGPATLAEIAPEILAAGRGGAWHVSGNVIEGHPEVTEDNRAGIDVPVGGITLLPDPVPFPHEVSTQPAAEAFETVLAGVGASLPRYDAADARLLADVRNGTGRLINSQSEVGGHPPLESAVPPVDSDHDGIPDEWELAHGLDPNDPSDGQAIGKDGYSNLERYLNSLQPDAAANPQVAITSPTLNQVFSATAAEQEIVIVAEATPDGDAEITAVDFFAGETHLGTVEKAPYRFVWSGVTDGTWFLTARATDSRGLKTQSTGTPVHVNRTTKLTGWTSTDVGDVPIAGSAAMTAADAFTIKGSGKIWAGNDAFQFVHQRIDAGPSRVVEIIARIDRIGRPYEGVYAGLMIRESLEPDSSYFTGGIGRALAEGRRGPIGPQGGVLGKASRFAVDGDEPSISLHPAGDNDGMEERPYWIRVIKRGLEFEAHLSPDSLQWTRIGYERIPMADRVYIGLVVDANKEANAIDNYVSADFSEVRVLS